MIILYIFEGFDNISANLKNPYFLEIKGPGPYIGTEEKDRNDELV